MKLDDVQPSTYIKHNMLNNNDKDPRFKVGDRVRLPKYKNIFAKGCTLI